MKTLLIVSSVLALCSVGCAIGSDLDPQSNAKETVRPSETTTAIVPSTATNDQPSQFLYEEKKAKPDPIPPPDAADAQWEANCGQKKLYFAGSCRFSTEANTNRCTDVYSELGFVGLPPCEGIAVNEPCDALLPIPPAMTCEKKFLVDTLCFTTFAYEYAPPFTVCGK